MKEDSVKTETVGTDTLLKDTDCCCPDCYIQRNMNEKISTEDHTKRKVIKGKWDEYSAAYFYMLMVWSPTHKNSQNPNGQWIQTATGNREWAEKTIKHYKLKAVSK